MVGKEMEESGRILTPVSAGFEPKHHKAAATRVAEFGVGTFLG